jgi:MFS family permease
MITNTKCRISDISNRSFRTNHKLAQLVAAEGVLFTLIITLAHNNNNLYASRLGASSSDLGLIASLPPIIGMLSLIPLAIITDRMHNKKPMVIFSAIGLGLLYILVGMTAFLDANRIPVLIGLLVFVNVPMSLYNSSWQAFFSDVCKPIDRNLVYTYRTRMNTAVGIIIPLIAGSILTAATGSDKILVHQIYYWLAFPLAVGQALILKKINGGYTAEVNHVHFSDVRESAKNMFHNKMFLGFLGVAILVFCGWEMDWSLYFVAQFKFLLLNESQMSLISVLGAAGQFITLGLWSRLISRKGVRYVFVIGVSGFALSSIVMIISILLPSPFRIPFYYVFQSIGASTYSAFQLSLLLCLLETVPSKNRAISIAIYNTIILATNVIMPYLGIYFYNVLGQSVRGILISFSVVALVRILSTGAAFIRWRLLRGEEDSLE